MPKFLATKAHEGSNYYAHWCEGCNEIHLVPNLRGGNVHWDFNGNFEFPSLSPSVRQMVPGKVCHYFIKNGQIDYCNDSFHALKGTSKPLLEIPEEELEWLE